MRLINILKVKSDVIPKAYYELQVSIQKERLFTTVCYKNNNYI